MDYFITLFSPQRVKIFLGTFLVTFLIVSLQQIGIQLPRIVSPLPEKKMEIFEEILPRLHVTNYSYSLKNQPQFITKAHASGPWDDAHAYVVVDFESGSVIAEKKSSTPVAIASLTKIMTSIVALDLASPSDIFTVSENAASQIPTKIGVKAGQQLTLDELLHAVMLTSANDAAEVIREGIDEKYGDTVFIKAMNKKAELLGLKHTSFTNPQGFDAKNHISSAEDLAILTHYALTHYPRFAEIVKKDYMLLEENSYHKKFDLYNWNGLIGVYPNVSGVKIGNTDAAKKTTVVVAERQGKKILVVLLGAPGIIERDLWASELLDLGFERTLGLDPINVTEEQLQAKYATWQYWN